MSGRKWHASLLHRSSGEYTRLIRQPTKTEALYARIKQQRLKREAAARREAK